MNETEQRIKLAEFEGWTKGKMETQAFSDPNRKAYCDGWRKSDWPPGAYQRPSNNVPPNYLHDLNACRHVFLRLTYDKRLTFAYHIREIVGKDYDSKKTRSETRWCFLTTPERLALVANATATQRCEALLRTIGQWTETPQLERTV